MIIRRTAFIQLCLFLTLGVTAAAIGIKLFNAPARAGGSDMFALASPLFFVIAAKNARSYHRTSVLLALLGVALAGGALWAALQ